MFFGYNTNGFAHHRLDDAIAILADLGYEGIALTVDHHVINPYQPDWQREAERVRGLLERYKLRCVVETGSRFLLDPRRKHQPTLVSRTEVERTVRLRFLELCIETAAILGADAVSFWSGTADDDADDDIVGRRLVEGCLHLIDCAHRRSVRLAFEPEPGMFIDTQWRGYLLRWNLLERDKADEDIIDEIFGWTIDINHLQCLEDPPISQNFYLEEWGPCIENLFNIHIADGRRGVHDHLMFGEGEIDFPPLFAALKRIDYSGGVYVELSRHSHDAVRVAEKSLAFLKGSSLGGTP